MKITVCGAAGRMGQAIVLIAKIDSDIQIAGALEYDGSKAIGTGCPAIASVNNVEKFLVETDVVIDFTNPESTLKNLETAKKYNTPFVIGTTGFSEDQRKRIAEISNSIPVVFSPNMSVGVNILFKLVEVVAKKIPDYDIEIVELHHNKKKDSPSGTAVKLSEVAASSIGKNIGDIGVYDRHSLDTIRKKDEIGVLSVRAGDIVGEHTVYFAGPGERIELTHRAHSRDTFARGAVRAARWVRGKEPGLYDMSDVLNLK
ncbi:4-hydroxy-tetrahydrodipicolinate reductase [Endomicrobiia bacterium]|nr:4-hydroxy-tetrahydrodipicolinate reductase [Endomicrobiia bacterium]GHT71218.1 4-hydroxy-tetrahydrodipicolinate reductase [Endomicrobiia bacterium]GHT75845.1 4-hydroxy-tetrahydrodipicolinate reductase [Endomicrobiia bacterium]